MSVYLISYDLNRPGQSYTELYEVLKQASTWWHYLESTWLISSPEPIDIWQKRIRAKIDENDTFLIVELSGSKPYSGWLAQKAWDWIKNHLR